MARLIERIAALFAEVRRRRVFRAAGLYLVAAWAVIEVTATVFPLLFVPEWVIPAVTVLAVLGFPVVLVLAWAFDLTPEGFRRPQPSSSRSAVQPTKGWNATPRVMAIWFASVVMASMTTLPSVSCVTPPSRTYDASPLCW